MSEVNCKHGDRLYHLIEALKTQNPFDHPVERFDLLETHISYILLTGLYAYKFKKPLDLGFLDFTTLEKRKFYCEEELRLNRRLAPAPYLTVIPITGTESSPRVGGGGPAIEYGIKMVQFSADAELDRVLERGQLLDRGQSKKSYLSQATFAPLRSRFSFRYVYCKSGFKLLLEILSAKHPVRLGGLPDSLKQLWLDRR